MMDYPSYTQLELRVLTGELVVLNAAAAVLLRSGRLAEALAVYRDAEDRGEEDQNLASAVWDDRGNFPEADLEPRR
eukprot:Skav221571  [mRNA]  locus=scaffold1376:539983:543467:- [translate_table: standard]